MTRGEGGLQLLFKHQQQPSKMSQRPKSHQVAFLHVLSYMFYLTCPPKLFKPYSLVQAQKIRSRAEEGGRQVLTKLLINPIAF